MVRESSQHMIFQQDRAPTYYIHTVKDIFDAGKSNSGIGKVVPTNQVARSPDLTPSDIFCGDMLKAKCTEPVVLI